MNTNTKLSKIRLTQSLRKFLENCQGKTQEIGVIDYSYSNYVSNFLVLSNTELFTEDSLDNYENLTQYYIHLIVQEANIKLRKIAKSILEHKAMLGQSSISKLVKSGFLKENQAVSIIVQLISGINKFFNQTSSDNIKEIAWMIYDDYGYLSIEDLIVFQYLCKKRHFASKFQHLNTKGANAEFLLIWLDAYQASRKKMLVETTNIFRQEGEILIGKITPFLVDFCNQSKRSRIKRQRLREKYKQLREQYLLEENSRSLWTRFVEFIAYEELRYQRAYFSMTNKVIEKLAKKQALQFLEIWKQDFLDGLWPIISQSKHAPTQKIALRNYYNSQMKIYLFDQMKNSSRVDAYSLLINELDLFIENKNIDSSETLWKVIYPNDCSKKVIDIELVALKYQIISKLLKRFSKEYQTHYYEALEADKFPSSKHVFLKMKAINWINTKILPPTK